MLKYRKYITSHYDNSPSFGLQRTTRTLKHEDYSNGSMLFCRFLELSMSQTKHIILLVHSNPFILLVFFYSNVIRCKPKCKGYSLFYFLNMF